MIELKRKVLEEITLIRVITVTEDDFTSEVLPVMLQLPFDIDHLCIELILFCCLSSIQVFVSHTPCIMRIAYLRRQAMTEHKKTWTVFQSML